MKKGRANEWDVSPLKYIYEAKLCMNINIYVYSKILYVFITGPLRSCYKKLHKKREYKRSA